MSGFVDAHHHIWRLNDLSWLNGPTRPRIFGDYESIKKDYLIEEYIADIKGSGVEKSVYIQVNWPPGEELREAEWIQNVSDKSGWPHALVGYVDFSSEHAATTLEKLNSFPIMRGIRQQLHWHENPLYCFQGIPDLMNQPSWRKNFSRLQEYGWSFELQVFASQMKDAARFASDFRETPMILQHCGMPEDMSNAGMAAWREGMRQLTQSLNVHCKFSGLGTFIHQNDPGFIGDITGECVEMFGVGRCLFGSNYPIEKIWSPYNPIVGAFCEAIAGLTKKDQMAIMRENALRLYRLEN